MDNFTERLRLSEDVKSIKFGEYFKKYTSAEHVSKWPECYAGHSPLTNMSLEHFHSEYKCLYMNRDQAQRFDGVIHLLVKKSNDDLTRRMIKVMKNPYTSRDYEVRRILNIGLKIQLEDIKEVNGAWKVVSQTQDNISYSVTLLQKCPAPLCLRCRDCTVCIHEIMCTCPFYNRGKLCKHIHAVCHQNAAVIATILPKFTRKEQLKELPQLEAFRTATHLSDFDSNRAKAVAAITTAHTRDKGEQAEFYAAVVQAYDSPKTPRCQLRIGASDSKDCNTTPKRSMAVRMEKITPQRRSAKKLRLE